MPSLFAALEDEVSTEIDAVFGEAFEILPTRTGLSVNERRDPDWQRPGRVVTAIFDAQSGDARLGPPPSPGLTTAMPWLSIDERELTGFPLARGDHMRRVDTGDVFEVSAIEPDGMGRSRVYLKHRKREG